MQTTKVRINELHTNAAQPFSRHLNVNELKQNIESMGLFYPILVDKSTMTIIDGHRRVECYKQLGYDHIDCRYINEQMEKANVNSIQAFGIVNKDTKKLTAKDFMNGYVAGGVLPANMVRGIVFLTERYGSAFVKKIPKYNFGIPSIVRLSNVAKNIGLNERSVFPKFLEWVANHKQYTILRALETSAFRKDSITQEIRTAFNENRSVNVSNF
jgi:hypothetical protein